VTTGAQSRNALLRSKVQSQRSSTARSPATSNLKSGTVKLLARELPRLFSDNWRHRLRIATIRVSAVVAQPLDVSQLGGGAALDVTEFDADGCAFSRTIMPVALWGEMLRAAAGVSA
jgi:hypothetical protein